jgi:septum formation protein
MECGSRDCGRRRVAYADSHPSGLTGVRPSIPRPFWEGGAPATPPLRGQIVPNGLSNDCLNRLSQFMNSHPIILASASPRRSQLFGRLGLPFEVIVPQDVEEILTGDSPVAVAETNARTKARAGAATHPDHWVIGADTIVVRDNIIYGKPTDRADALRMLGELVGCEHQVYTAVCLCRQAGQQEIAFCDRTRVWMQPLTPTEIERYVDTVHTLDKAGSYAIQDGGEAIVQRIEGSFTNVMGLPMESLTAALREIGIHCSTAPL